MFHRYFTQPHPHSDRCSQWDCTSSETNIRCDFRATIYEGFISHLSLAPIAHDFIFGHDITVFYKAFTYTFDARSPLRLL